MDRRDAKRRIPTLSGPQSGLKRRSVQGDSIGGMGRDQVIMTVASHLQPTEKSQKRRRFDANLIEAWQTAPSLFYSGSMHMQATGANAEPSEVDGLKVMVIDDSNTIRRSAEIFLLQAGCQVILPRMVSMRWQKSPTIDLMSSSSIS